MPSKRIKELVRKGYLKKSALKRKPRNKRIKTNVVRNYGVSLIPDVYLTKMRYHQQLDVEANTDPITVNAYKLTMSGNSIFDANQSSIVNGYPLGYNEMRMLYRKFYVSLSKIRVQAMCTNGGVATGYRIFILPSTRDSVSGIDVNSLIANPYASRPKYFGPAFGRNIVNVNHGMSTKSIFGRSSAKTENDFHGEFATGIANGDPRNEFYYHIIVESINDAWSPNAGRVQLQVSLDYSVMLYQRRQQIQDPIGTLDNHDEENGPEGPQPPFPPGPPGPT